MLDHGDVSTFASANALWDCFQDRPAPFIITDRRFGEEFDGLDLVRGIRKRSMLPYVFVLMRSTMKRVWPAWGAWTHFWLLVLLRFGPLKSAGFRAASLTRQD